MYKTYTPAITIILMLSNFIIEMEGEERTKGPNFVKLELQVIPKTKIREGETLIKKI